VPKLSVITACYNAEKYLSVSVQSVLSQTFQDFELIIIDDGSTDSSKSVLEAYINHPNIAVIFNKYNEGVAYCRNKALQYATGEYIAVQDADDVSLPNRFEKQVQFLNDHPEVTVVGSHALKISSSGTEIGSMAYPPKTTEQAFFVIKHFKLNPIIDPSSMFRKDPILKIGAYRLDPELRTAQDFDLWCRLLNEGHQLYNFQEPLIKYRENPLGVTHSKRKEQRIATDLIWAAFKKRSFPKVEFRPDYFKEGIDLSFLNK
jgi:glycosyltransferase involved in cell wall biosynthesis